LSDLIAASYVYDYANRLTALGVGGFRTTTYGYAADGTRVLKRVRLQRQFILSSGTVSLHQESAEQNTQRRLLHARRSLNSNAERT
jgi:hypothetical protein